jgi:hypothetical protein
MRSKSRSRLAAFAAAFVLGTSWTGAQAPQGADDKLVVHEWGTFTSVQGSNGIALEGLQHEEERLPGFVYSRTKVRDCPLRQYGYKGLEVPVTNVTQKMETPVIYFHTAKARTLDVRVDFVKGLITQWYPVSDRLGPPEGTPAQGALDLAKVERSFLEWKIELHPAGEAVWPEPPAVGGTDPWAFARAVDAATVRTLPRQRTERMGPTESEKYLFYRGLGTFSLPVTIEASEGGRVTVRNGGKLPLAFAYALEMTGDAGRFQAVGGIAGGAEKRVAMADVAVRPKAEVVAALEDAVRDSLVASGLYGDEARAMVRTWSRAWFRSDGTRIIYSVPRADLDALLPLSIKPAPDALVRVLVGRIEYMTPETEAAVEAALRDRGSSDSSKRDAAMARLVAFDRFLEPHVRRVLARSGDAAVKKSGEEVLAGLKN